MSNPAYRQSFWGRPLALAAVLAGVFFWLSGSWSWGADLGVVVNDRSHYGFWRPVVKTDSFLDSTVLFYKSLGPEKKTGQAGLLGGLFFLLLVIAWDLTALVMVRWRVKGLVKAGQPSDWSGLDPGLFRFWRFRSYDHKTLALCLVSLAVKGYLIIKFKQGHFSLYQKPAGFQPLWPLEKKVMLLFFSVDKSLTLEKSNYDIISTAVASFYLDLHKESEKKFIKFNIGYLLPSLILALLGTAVMAVGSDNIPWCFSIASWIWIWSLGLMVSLFFLVKSLGSYLWGPGSKFMALGYFFLTFLYLGGVTGGIFYYCSMVSWLAGLLLSVLIFSSVFFYILLKIPSLNGGLVARRIRDLAEHLTGLACDPGTGKKNSDLFEKYLAYALSLNLENQWCEKFFPCLVNRAEEENDYTPSWYWGDSLDRLGPFGFARIWSRSLPEAISWASLQPGARYGPWTGD